MDSIIYTNSGAPLVTPWSARGMSNETFAALSKADAQKREVESDAMKVLDQPKMKADQDQRNYLRSKIQSIVERLKVLQKLFSNDGREMARAITQIFKELKAALKQYKELAGKELGGVDGMVSQVLAGVPSAPKDDDTAKAEDTNADDTSSDATVKTADAEADAAPATDAQTSASDNKTPTPTTDGDQPSPSAAAFDGDKTALYKAVDAKVRDMVGEDAMDFLKSVRGLVKTIEEKFLAKARIQIAAMKPDKDLERVVKELNDSEKDLNKEMDDMDHDLKAAVPGLGMHLDVAA